MKTSSRWILLGVVVVGLAYGPASLRAQAPTGMHTSCACNGLTTFYAYDCTSKLCCFAP